MTSSLIERESSFLVVVDLQDRLAPAISGFDSTLAAASAMAKAAVHMDIPVIFTEHCVDKVGPTAPSIRAIAPDAPILHKTHFNTLAEPEHRTYFDQFKGKRPIICGTETHVCVLQTLMGFLAAGFAPLLAVDACGSRKAVDKDIGVSRMIQAGAEPVTAEMVIFEWLHRADSDLFRAVLPVIKDLK